MLEDFCEKWADLAFLWELHGFPIEMCFVFSVFCWPPGQPLPRYTKMTAEKDAYFYSFVHKNAAGNTWFYRAQNRRLSAAKSAFFGRRRFTLESPTRWTPPARMSCSLHPTSGPYPSLRCLLSRRLARSCAEFFGTLGTFSEGTTYPSRLCTWNPTFVLPLKSKLQNHCKNHQKRKQAVFPWFFFSKFHIWHMWALVPFIGYLTYPVPWCLPANRMVSMEPPQPSTGLTCSCDGVTTTPTLSDGRREGPETRDYSCEFQMVETRSTG